MRRLLAVIAAVVVVGSMVWGFRMLAREVTPPEADALVLSCGRVFGSLAGEPLYGGENPYPDDWIDLCRDAAKEQVRWIAVPVIAGPLALLYVVVAYVRLVRRTTAEDRLAADGRGQGRVPGVQP